MRTMITVAIDEGHVDGEDPAPATRRRSSQPPASGPMTIAMPPHAVHEPIAAPRSSGGKVATITASALGVSSAPKTPCSARPATSTSIDGRQRAEDADDAEARDAEREDPPLAVEVAERAADEDQRAEREQVGVGDPLLAGEAAAEVALDGGQRDVDRRCVEPRHERAQDRGQQRQALATLGPQTMLRRREIRACGGSGEVGHHPAADSKRRGPEPPGVLSATIRPEGLHHGFRAAGLTTPGPRSLRLGSASGRNLWWGPRRRSRAPRGDDPANTGDFRGAVARPRTLGRAADRGHRGERTRHRQAPSAS